VVGTVVFVSSVPIGVHGIAKDAKNVSTVCLSLVRSALLKNSLIERNVLAIGDFGANDNCSVKTI
jgi:hypothetical protein